MTIQEAKIWADDIAAEFSREELAAGGKIFYNGPAAFRPGRFCIYGLNPGIPKPGRVTEGQSLQENISDFPSKNGNDNYGSIDKSDKPSPLQRRFRTIVDDYLYGERPETVVTTNIIFRRSRSLSDLGMPFEQAAARCWPIHERILNIVRPRLILAFGSGFHSAYWWLSGQMPEKFCTGWRAEERRLASGHGGWKVCCVRGTLMGRPTTLVGMPHLGRYKPHPESEGMMMLKQEISQLD